MEPRVARGRGRISYGGGMNVTSAKLPDSYHYSTHNLTPDDTPLCCDWKAAGENLFVYDCYDTHCTSASIFVIVYIVHTASQHSRNGKRSEKAFFFFFFFASTPLHLSFLYRVDSINLSISRQK